MSVTQMKNGVGLLLILLGIGGMACTKALIHGRDRPMKPISESFAAPQIAVFEAAEQALKDLDYKVEYANPESGVLRTGWKSTTADSHYVKLFGRDDYGTTGSYYHITVEISAEDDGRSKATVAAPIRGIVGMMESSHREEKEVLSRIADHVRPANLNVTNIGVID